MRRAEVNQGLLDHALRNALIAFVALVAFGLSAGGALALDVSSAKTQGLVGEQVDGYLGIPHPPGSAEVQELVADTNLKRREFYQQRAAALSPPVSLAQYEAVIGAKLVEEAKSGEYVRGADGVWVQK